jgi:hypothetical protein
VLELLNVQRQIIELFVHVPLGSSVIHSQIVIKNQSRKLNAHLTLTVHLIQLVSIKDVGHHALKEIHALKMLNVVSHIIDHFATVHQDGAEIQIFDATNVS